jgi:hypothetical protein
MAILVPWCCESGAAVPDVLERSLQTLTLYRMIDKIPEFHVHSRFVLKNLETASAIRQEDARTLTSQLAELEKIKASGERGINLYVDGPRGGALWVSTSGVTQIRPLVVT